MLIYTSQLVSAEDCESSAHSLAYMLYMQPMHWRFGVSLLCALHIIADTLHVGLGSSTKLFSLVLISRQSQNVFEIRVGICIEKC